jgi:LysR family transcriptional regulator, chromosome initiation inhibitor
MLDARQLEALAAVVDHGGFGPAAKALSLTLSAVSLRIRSLEEALGQRMLVRGKQVHATPAGQALLTHIRQVQLMEADLMADLPGSGGGIGGAAGRRKPVPMQSMAVAVNADSLATWFLSGVMPVMQKHRTVLDIVVDDQDHTHDALKSGEVSGCVTTLAEPMRGCLSEPLGTMRYRCVAAPEQVAQWKGPRSTEVTPHRLLAHPAIIFNRKDALQDAFSAAALWPARRPLPAPFRARHRSLRGRHRTGAGLGHGERFATGRPRPPPTTGRGAARPHGGRGPVLAALEPRTAHRTTADPGGERSRAPAPAACPLTLNFHP